MNRLFLVPLLLFVSSPATASTITLPDKSAFDYWIRSATGAIEKPPTGIVGVRKIIVANADIGATLYILDQHTGGIATVPITLSNAEVQSADFKLPASASPPASQSVGATTKQSTSTTPDNGTSLVSRIATGVLSLLLLAGVLLFMRKLFTSRGQLLIDAARKAGVDIPNPSDSVPSAVTTDGKYEPKPVARVQPVPESAYRSPPTNTASGYLIASDGTSYGIGGKTTTIGREDGNDIVLNDPSVSRRHAVIESTSIGVQIVDQSSSNGTYLNGERVDSGILVPGTKLLIGTVPLKYEK
jgi:hypothetical protein